jgi:PAS domain S-box-containing protein
MLGTFNWITIVWPMVASACLVLGLIHLRIVFGDGQRAPHLFFAIAAFAVAVVSGFELTLLCTSDLARYQEVLRWAVVPIGIMVAATACFIRSFFGTGRLWLLVAGVALNLVAQAANLLSAEPVVRHAVDLKQVTSFGGAAYTVPTIINGSWERVELLSVLLVLAFMADASWQLWKKGGRRRAVVVGGGALFFLFVARGHAVLIENGLLQTPYFVSFAFLGVICAMAHELSSDVLRVAMLSRRLRESEWRSDLAARAASLGFWTLDIQKDELWASDSARALFGVSPDERISMNRFFELVHPDHRDAVKRAIENSLKGSGEYEVDYRVQLDDGRIRWISAHGRTDFDEAGKPRLFSGALADITERRQSEIELRQLRGQLAHAGRVSVMGQLAASMAHELNQPLGAILSNAEAAELFLKQDPPALNELADILADIRKDDERAGEVIRRMRALLRRQDMECVTLDVNPLVQDVFRLVSADAALRQTVVQLDLAPDLPGVEGDRIHLQQVVLNLIMNALEAMGAQSAPKRVVMVSTRRGEDGTVRLCVADSGPGISEASLPLLFDPFFTTKPNGMGMGLAICHRIIEAHAGRIRAENRAEGGALFTVTLPARAGVSSG